MLIQVIMGLSFTTTAAAAAAAVFVCFFVSLIYFVFFEVLQVRLCSQRRNHSRLFINEKQYDLL